MGIRAGVVVLLVPKSGLAHECFETLTLDSQQLFPLDSSKRANPFQFLSSEQMPRQERSVGAKGVVGYDEVGPFQRGPGFCLI
jgi:hypothetical protein